MRSPGLAIAWEFGRRHRIGFVALFGYVLVLATRALVVGPGPAFTLDDSGDLPMVAERFAATVLVPVSLLSYYLFAVFTFGTSGDLAGRRSLYPARMFALPVTTMALAAWPMLYGAATLGALWLAATRFALWPAGVDVPLIGPALFAVAFLAWTQVLVWLPYGLRGLRVAVAVVWLTAMGLAAVVAIERQVSERLAIALLAPQLPLAFLAARGALARARRGDVPDWSGALGRSVRLDVIGYRAPFASAAHAQRWFEWRLHGRSLPVWVAILVPCELALLFVAGTGNPSLAAYTLAGALVTPPFMAAFVSRAVRAPGPFASDAYGLPPFTVTRPVTGAALVAAKLRMTLWSTLAAWAVVVVTVPAMLTVSATWPVVTGWARQLGEAVGTPRAVVVALLVLAALVVWTWRQLVQGLYVGLSGRVWMIRLSTGIVLTLLIFIEPIVQWLHDDADVRIALWNALPWIFAVLVLVKMSAAASIAVRLYATRLLGDRALVIGAACWLVAVLGLHAVLVWLFSTPYVPRYILLLLAILAVPLARLSAAPLALAANRHR